MVHVREQTDDSAGQHAPRYWTPRGGDALSLSGDFLVDPESEFGRALNPAVRRLDDLADVPCLVLLGEPGSGKSTDLARAAHAATARPAAPDAEWVAVQAAERVGGPLHAPDLARLGRGSAEAAPAVVWLDLRDVASEASLTRRLAEDPAVRDWRTGTGRLVLFLDSLDEGLLSVETLAGHLADELRRLVGVAHGAGEADAQESERDASPAGAAPAGEASAPSPDRRREPWEGGFAIRIACRAVEWPASLERALRALFGDDAVSVWHLAPLRERDIEEAARGAGIDEPGALVGAIRAAGAGPLAQRPVTLGLLLALYRRARTLPASRRELYARGVRLLCEEVNPSRQERRRTGTLTADERFAVAARVAATTVFANRAAVWTAVDRGDVPDSDVPEGELIGGTEPTPEGRVPVTGQALDETLRISGLFAPAGPNRLGWAHRTFAEFLAAEYVRAHGMRLPQVASLLLVDIDGEPRETVSEAFSQGVSRDVSGSTRPTTPPDVVERRPRVAPQLHETAAWLAAMRDDVFALLGRYDPVVLLGSDVSEVAVAPAATRARLADALLDLADAREEPHVSHVPRRLLARLAHPGLVAQLATALDAANASDDRRAFALQLAGAVGADALTPRFGDYLAAPGVALALRADAARALAEIVRRGAGVREVSQGRAALAAPHADPAGPAADHAALHLMAALDLGPEEDPEDELHGLALAALYPTYLSPEELLSLIRPRRRPHFIGSYAAFLLRVGGEMTPADALAAVRWADARRSLTREVFTVIARALASAVDAVETPPDRAPFARVLGRALMGRHRELSQAELSKLASALQAQPERRRAILEAFADAGDGDEPSRHVRLLSMGGLLLLPDDAPWLLGRLVARSAARSQRSEYAASAPPTAPVGIDATCVGTDDGDRALALALRWVLPPDDATLASAVIEAALQSPAIADAFAHLLGSVDLDSERARAAREDERMERESRTPPRPPGPEPTPSAWMDRLLDILEGGARAGLVAAGDVAAATEVMGYDDSAQHALMAWWRLLLVLTLEPPYEYYGRFPTHDPRASPGWRDADVGQRARIVRAAARYVRLADPDADAWLGTASRPYAALAGNAALRLLQAEATAEFASLPTAVWVRWAPAVLASYEAPLDESHTSSGAAALVARVYASAPTAAAGALVKMLGAADRSASVGDALATIRVASAAGGTALDGARTVAHTVLAWVRQWSHERSEASASPAAMDHGASDASAAVVAGETDHAKTAERGSDTSATATTLVLAPAVVWRRVAWALSAVLRGGPPDAQVEALAAARAFLHTGIATVGRRSAGDGTGRTEGAVLADVPTAPRPTLVGGRSISAAPIAPREDDASDEADDDEADDVDENAADGELGPAGDTGGLERADVPDRALRLVRALALAAGRVLLLNALSEAWDDLRALVQSAPDLWRSVARDVSGAEEAIGAALATLPEDRLVELFAWLEQAAPYHDDPERVTGRMVRVTPSRMVGDWRNRVLRTLEVRGTVAAVAALDALARARPDLPWLAWTAGSARAAARRAAWQPVTPSVLRGLARHRDRRLVRNGRELLAVVEESLRRLQNVLTGETPAVESLWDEQWPTHAALKASRAGGVAAVSTFRPKRESALANEIKRHLMRDLIGRGIVANREVELRPSLAGRGSETDVHVHATVRRDARTGTTRPDGEHPDYAHVAVVIEVKGAWNADLDDALESQLAARYLAPHSDARHGLYVAGWYASPAWDCDDWRVARTRRAGPRERLERRLKAQADRATGPGQVLRAFVLDVSLVAPGDTGADVPPHAVAPSDAGRRTGGRAGVPAKGGPARGGAAHQKAAVHER
jgi:hypothetical protein